ncbi:macrophage mannose receptor 1-like [Lepisosteus oculatus]|uniref:macrophage mannose receptor 1-like n=1 Tax=Lepisosteus oculatus TaxID=7918 RepID=UPI0037241271
MLSRLMERRGLAVLLLAGLSVVTHGRSRRPYLVKTAMSWLDARQYCRQGDDGDLATVLDQSQLQQLLVAAQGSSAPQVWIGLYQDQPRWQWSSGDEVTYYNWNRTYFCAKVNAEGTWEDAVCDDLNYFMCSTDSSQGSRTYTLIKQSKTWAAARDHCRQQHTDLVTISSPRENQAVRKIAGGSVFWIGLFNQPWEWSDGGDSSFRLWAPGDPDNQNGTELCVSVTGPSVIVSLSVWYDMNCLTALSFLCCDADRSRSIADRCVFMSTLMSWSQAQSHCRSLNKDLVTIYSQQENQQLQQFPGYILGLSWIGMYHGKESWQWVSGERASYANWKTQLFCATAGPDGYWTDVVCDELHYFMCYTDSSQGSRTYTLIEQNKTWAAARDHCRQQHTDLVTISSPSENQAVREAAQGSVFWIGLFNEPWEWSDGGDSSFRNWTTGEPNNMGGNEKCVLLSLSSPSRGALIDKNCGRAFPFLCLGDARDIVLVKENRSWEEALDYCRTHHTDLTSLLSQTEQDLAALEVEGARSPHVWLGLRQSVISGSWFWVNREPLGYTAWAQGEQPQCPQSGRCGAMSTETSSWAALGCEEKLNFLCYTA